MTKDDEQKRLDWLAEHQPELEAMLTRQRRFEWLAGMLKTVAIWLAAIMAGWVALRQGITDLTGGSK